MLKDSERDLIIGDCVASRRNAEDVESVCMCGLNNIGLSADSF